MMMMYARMAPRIQMRAVNDGVGEVEEVNDVGDVRERERERRVGGRRGCVIVVGSGEGGSAVDCEGELMVVVRC